MKKIIILGLLFLILSIGICRAEFLSNADIDNEDMVDITDWTDDDDGTGASTQATFDGKSCMKLSSGANGSPGNNAQVIRDIGSYGNRTIFSMSIYCDAIGTQANGDGFSFDTYDGATRFLTQFCSDGFFVNDGVSWNEVGTNLVVQDTWQEWTFDVDWVTKTTDVYLDGVLKASDVDCSYASVTAEGTVTILQFGFSTTNRLTYVDWFKAGSDFVSGAYAFIL